MVNKKGEMSLEMIIGLIILLVLAAIVISMIVQTIKPPETEKLNCDLMKERFIENCKLLCKNKDFSKYCKTYFKGDDWDCDQIKNEIVEVGPLSWDACEDRIYCFLAVDCSNIEGDQIEFCRRYLCQNLEKKYSENLSAANKKLHELISPGSCGLLEKVEKIDNWYLRYFDGDVCKS